MSIFVFITMMVCSLISATSQSNGFRGISPLVSTRSDVERLIGPCPQRDGPTCMYETSAETIIVTYSDGPCEKGWPFGYNVPANTVIRIDVSPTNYVHITAILPNLETYHKRVREDGSLIYIDDQEGFAVEVFEGKVGTMIYGSTAKQAHLRCPDSYERLQNGRYTADAHRRVFEYGDVREADEVEYLSGFARLLKRQSIVQGYIISYAGQRSFRNEARRRLQCQKTYLIKEHGIDPDRITTIDGGYRSIRAVELYLFPKGSAVPLPFPTVRPSRVEILKDGELTSQVLSPCSNIGLAK